MSRYHSTYLVRAGIVCDGSEAALSNLILDVIPPIVLRHQDRTNVNTLLDTWVDRESFVDWRSIGLRLELVKSASCIFNRLIDHLVASVTTVSS